MKGVKLTVIVCCVTLLGLGVAVTTRAQTSDDKTFITFSAPVELPGKTLPAGKYTFRLLDSPSNRHIIQVLSEDGTDSLGIFLALAAERREVTDDVVITFAERSADVPPAVRYWYYPGKSIGHEFVYPKDQAMRIARASGQPVLATESTVTQAEMTTAEVTTVEPSGESRAATAAEMEARRQRDVAEAQTAPPPAVEERPDVGVDRPAAVGTTGSELPRTASPLPLAGAIGLLALGGATVVRRLRKRP